MKTRVQAHAAYRLSYHIVWIPKYRREVLVKGVAEYFEETLRNYVIDRYPDVILEEIKAMKDHVHIMVVIPPKYSISSVIQSLKANMSKQLRSKFEYLRRSDNLWSVGYFVSSVGSDEKRTREYIEYQEKQDKGRVQLVLGEETMDVA